MTELTNEETVEQVSDSGGCSTCDVGIVAHTTTDGVTYLCIAHLDGAHD